MFTRIRIGCAALGLWLASMPALAQVNDGSVKEGTIQITQTERPILEYLIFAIGLIAVLAVGFKPSGRVKDA